MTTAPVVERIETSAYTVPTDAHEADGTFAWDSTTLVLVQAWAGGEVGIGWTYASTTAAALGRQTLTPIVTGRSLNDITAVWTDLSRALRNIGHPGISAMALSAVDCALWDLKARLLDVPLHHLLGVAHSRVPLYGSGGFTSYDEEKLNDQLVGWVHTDQLTRVKIKIGESWGTREARDLARVRQARGIVGDDVELFVDANGGYTVGQAIRIAHRLDELDVRWFEEPVSSDDLAGLRHIRQHCLADVAAGEYGDNLSYFQVMCAAEALDCVQVDVTRCGGITEFLRIAAVAAAHHLEVSGHCAPYQHVAVLASVPNLRHLEWFHDHVRIERLLFDNLPQPENGSLAPRDVPGNGYTWCADAAERFRTF